MGLYHYHLDSFVPEARVRKERGWNEFEDNNFGTVPIIDQYIFLPVRAQFETKQSMTILTRIKKQHKFIIFNLFLKSTSPKPTIFTYYNKDIFHFISVTFKIFN